MRAQTISSNPEINTPQTNSAKSDSSFRDPSGFVFYRDGILYRQINQSYREDYEFLKSSGIYAELAARKLLVPHEETDIEPAGADGYLVIRPLELPVISYPYEWSFSQLKDAALLTLELQKYALSKGATLKDASAYNVQLFNGRPVFIDTLSFERRHPGRPWAAYRQFCQHFLAPLALMARRDAALGQLLKTNIDGIPLALASRLLPFSTWLNPSLMIHVHLHAGFQSRYADTEQPQAATGKGISDKSLAAIIDSLITAVRKLDYQPSGSEWHDYYNSNNNYAAQAMSFKKSTVTSYLEKCRAGTAWDLGANTGAFSNIAARYCDYVCAWDKDPACVEIHYRQVRDGGMKNIFPLLLDLSNPSPGIGWGNNERLPFMSRGPVDVILALGIVHHLVIANNVPMDKVAGLLAALTDKLIIEFVAKSDTQVGKLLRNRLDIFPDYNIDGFERVFSRYFRTIDKTPIPDTGRTLYLMQIRGSLPG